MKDGLMHFSIFGVPSGCFAESRAILSSSFKKADFNRRMRSDEKAPCHRRISGNAIL